MEPSVEGLEKCWKADLCAVAAHYGIDVARSLTKGDMKALMVGGLVGGVVLGG